MDISSHISITNTYDKETLNISDMSNGGGSAVSVEKWGNNVTAYIDSLSIDKKIYSPNRVECTIAIKASRSDSSAKPIDTSVLIKSLLDGKLSLWQKVSNETKFIAQDYLIHEVEPEIENKEGADSQTGYYFAKVHVIAYSPDQMLTYDKYSRAYTCKRLCDDIISTELSEPKKDDNGKVAVSAGMYKMFPYSNFSKDTLHNMVYSPDGTTSKEVMMPYLVQYNESFYDFLRRVTYRCGEYLFFEDGKLHVGLNIPEEKSDDKKIRFVKKIGLGRHKTVRRTSHSNNLNDKDDMYANDISFNEEYSFENYAMMVERDPNKSEWVGKASTWLGIVANALGKGDLYEMGITAASDFGLGKLKDSQNTDSSNKDHNETFEFDKDEASTDEKAKRNTTGQHDKSSAGAEKFFPFMYYGSKDQLLAAAYSQIRSFEEDASGLMQHLELDMANYQHLCLGQVVMIEGCDGRYVVVNIHREETCDNGKYSIDVVPLYVDAEKKAVCPPKQDDIESVRNVGPQTAYVTDTDDAAGLGRVKVRFHWQTKEDDATPLIRLSSQMASSDAGFRFSPNKGDEVIVNFSNGNAERPYVAGALFNSSKQAPSESRTIRSSHGHSITFDDSGDDTDFGKSLLPIWKPIAMGMGIKAADDKKFHTGGITLADDCGLYKLDLSASERAITIESPMGTVTVNAFTGITISAPNGDVNIEGKNVNIVAGNNITMTSGKNKKLWEKCKKKKFGSKEAGALTIANSVVDFGAKAGKPYLPKILSANKQFIDMEAVRNVMECFARPQEGKLCLHSERSVMLEAGGSDTVPVMPEMDKAYNQSLIRQSRSSLVYAAVKEINSIFYDLYTKITNFQSDPGTYPWPTTLADQIIARQKWFLDDFNKKVNTPFAKLMGWSADIGLTVADFTEIANYAGRLTADGTSNKVTDDNGEVDQARLLEVKRKYLYKIVKGLTDNKYAGWKTAITGSGNTLAKKVSAGAWPDTPPAWANVINDIDKADDSKIASFVNNIAKDALKTFGIDFTNLITGFKGISDECGALRNLNDKGEIYLSTNDAGTVHLNNTGLDKSDGLDADLNSIKDALMADVI